MPVIFNQVIDQPESIKKAETVELKDGTVYTLQTIWNRQAKVKSSRSIGMEDGNVNGRERVI